MDDLVDLSAQIETDIAKYENLLTQARHTQSLPVPDGHEEPRAVELIQRIIADLGKLRDTLVNG